MAGTLFSFGHGASAQALGRSLLEQGWQIFGTTRDEAKAERLRQSGVTPILWEDTGAIVAALGQSDHLLTSVAPNAEGDPVLARFNSEIEQITPQLRWAGYLSTTGVYGDHDGGWVDETTPPEPSTERGKFRVLAEAEWSAVPGLNPHIFRLAGIYGPGRGPFAKIRKGTAKRIIKKNQVFSRIHVEDIAQVLAASIERPNPGAIYNVCDDHPVPPQDVLEYAAELLNVELPPAETIEDAEMSKMARSFYADSKRVSNKRIKDELGVELLYPDYRTGLDAVLRAETAQAPGPV